MNIVLHADAIVDIDEISIEYQIKRVGQSDRFLFSLKQTIDRISENPELYGRIKKNIRVAPIQRFPYFIYYIPRQNELLIFAVRHGRDNPKI